MIVTYILGKWKGIGEIKNIPKNIRLVICNTMYYNNFEGQVFSMKDNIIYHKRDQFKRLAKMKHDQ